jgi:alanyl-tRNA synthetase
MDENKIAQDDPQYELHCLRHSAAHLMAHAVQTFFPEAKFAIGPVIKDGFYYDMDLPRALTPEDLDKIEAKMKELAKTNQPFIREEWDKQTARTFFTEHNQTYKLEIIDGIGDETVSVYKEGDFIDLCAGPHVRYTSKIKHFKLQKVSGAYWRGDEKNPMLQRIYGTAFQTKDELEKHLFQLEEAKKREEELKVLREREAIAQEEKRRADAEATRLREELIAKQREELAQKEREIAAEREAQAKLNSEREAKQREEEEKARKAQAEEAARLKAEVEAKQAAEAEARKQVADKKMFDKIQIDFPTIESAWVEIARCYKIINK